MKFSKRDFFIYLISIIAITIINYVPSPASWGSPYPARTPLPITELLLWWVYSFIFLVALKIFFILVRKLFKENG